MRGGNAPASAKGSPASRCPYPQVPDPNGGQDIDVLNLHQALDDLAVLDPRQAEVVELRYFGGLKIEEIAEARSACRRRRSSASSRPRPSGSNIA
jgi:DNA-directed RNA polymerase specialized sigma24 family protein